MNTLKLLLILISLSTLQTVFAAGVVVLAGGGDEGMPGDEKAWSYQLYKRLIDNGDINGDKKIKVAVVSYYKQEDSWYQDYFKSLGATNVVAVEATSKKEANDPKIVDQLKDADVVFFRGGDQSEYYHLWKDSLLFKQIKEIDKKGGAIGGTSAGAMSLAGYALAGGQELGGKDVLKDAQSKLLNDKKGGSSIHNDFLNIVPDAIVETHYGERARLGRALGVHAKASEDYKRHDLLTIAISEQTGVAISNGKAKVYGNGTVEFLQQTPETKSIRRPGSPLVYTDIRNDVLIEGWTFDLKRKLPDLDRLPSDATALSLTKKCGSYKTDFVIDGSKKSDASFFEFSPKFGTESYQLSRAPKDSAKIFEVIGITRGDTYDEDPSGGNERAKIQAALYRALYDSPNRTGILLSEESSLQSDSKKKNLIIFEKNPNLKEKESSSIILDCGNCSYKGLSSRVTELDNVHKSLHLPALINLRVHVLGESKKNNLGFNLSSHQIEGRVNTEDDCHCNSASKKNSLINVMEKLSTCEK